MDKGHCKIAYEDEHDQLEISDYYDFSSSYSYKIPDNIIDDDGDEDFEDIDSDLEDFE